MEEAPRGKQSYRNSNQRRMELWNETQDKANEVQESGSRTFESDTSDFPTLKRRGDWSGPVNPDDATEETLREAQRLAEKARKLQQKPITKIDR